MNEERFDTPSLWELPQILLREKQNRKLQTHPTELCRQVINELKTYYYAYQKYSRELTNTQYTTDSEEYKEIIELKGHFKKMVQKAIDNMFHYQAHRYEVLQGICVECNGIHECIQPNVLEHLSEEEKKFLKRMCDAFAENLKKKASRLKVQTSVFSVGHHMPSRQINWVQVVFLENRVLRDLLILGDNIVVDRLYLKNSHLHIPKKDALEGEKCGYLRILTEEYV